MEPEKKYLTSNRDTDYTILLELSDRDLFNFCASNSEKTKACDDDQFWHQRFIKKFGNTNLKDRNESWKNFYLEVVMFIDLEDMKEIERYDEDEYSDFLRNVLKRAFGPPWDVFDFLMKYFKVGARYLPVGLPLELTDRLSEKYTFPETREGLFTLPLLRKILENATVDEIYEVLGSMINPDQIEIAYDPQMIEYMKNLYEYY